MGDCVWSNHLVVGDANKQDYITNLPDVLLQTCLAFVGPGHYRFVAATCRRFHDFYDYETSTMIANAASCVSCAKLCIREIGSPNAQDTVRTLATKAASMGQVKVIQWALDDHSYKLQPEDFISAVHAGHLNVLEWEKDNAVDMNNWWQLCEAAAQSGHVHILKWIHEQHSISCSARVGAQGGHVPVLQWMKKVGFDLQKWEVWIAAAREGHVHILDWLHDEVNGFENHQTSILRAAAVAGRTNVLLWARDKGITWSNTTCAFAAAYGRLDVVQWLRENECPWSGDTIRSAWANGHPDVVQWARENGCPE